MVHGLLSFFFPVEKFWLFIHTNIKRFGIVYYMLLNVIMARLLFLFFPGDSNHWVYLRLKDSYFVRLKQASSIQSCLSGILAMQDENHFSVPRGITYLEHAAWFCYFQPKFLFKSRHVNGRGFMQDLILQSLTIEPSRHNRFDHKNYPATSFNFMIPAKEWISHNK